jgi:uroporphyrinogen-III synthase
MPFDGLRVLSLESRRSVEMSALIRNQKGEPIAAPSMREVPIERNEQAFQFGERLFAGDFEMVILLTGVGTRYLDKVLAARWPEGTFAEALRKLAVVVRGPKPMAVMREWQVPVAILVPEPNTWREVLHEVAPRVETRVAVQEYGKPSPELVGGLRAQGREVTPVPVYQWDFPEDIGPLQEAARRLAAREIDVVLFTTSIQIAHLARIAEEMGTLPDTLAGLRRAVIASIGPTTTEALAEHNLYPDLEPSHPKMGVLVLEASQKAAALLASKRVAHAHGQ